MRLRGCPLSALVHTLTLSERPRPRPAWPRGRSRLPVGTRGGAAACPEGPAGRAQPPPARHHLLPGVAGTSSCTADWPRRAGGRLLIVAVSRALRQAATASVAPRRAGPCRSSAWAFRPLRLTRISTLPQKAHLGGTEAATCCDLHQARPLWPPSLSAQACRPALGGESPACGSISNAASERACYGRRR